MASGVKVRNSIVTAPFLWIIQGLTNETKNSPYTTMVTVYYVQLHSKVSPWQRHRYL